MKEEKNLKVLIKVIVGAGKGEEGCKKSQRQRNAEDAHQKGALSLGSSFPCGELLCANAEQLEKHRDASPPAQPLFCYSK